MQNMQTIESTKGLRVDSRDVAELLGRRHSAVLRDIDNIRDGFENEFKLDNYQTDNPRTYRKYMLTEKGFKLLLSNVNGFNHIKADMENVFLSLTGKKGGNKMQELQIFQNTQFGNLEILTIEDKEWFPAIKVAELLGYTNPRDAVNRHTKQKGVANHDVLSNGGMQNKKFIDEGNLYRLITKSKLPQAEQFEEWVFEEVIPSIRKTGNYQVPQTPMQALEMMFSVQKEQQEFNNRIETEVTGIRNIVGMETKNWRNDTNKVLGAIAQHLGGGQKHKTVRTEAYKLLEEKGRCKLEQRLNNRKAKMLAKGATKTQINKLSKLDVINDEPRLIEIYISAIKSMAIKYGVDTDQFEI